MRHTKPFAPTNYARNAYRDIFVGMEYPYYNALRWLRSQREELLTEIKAYEVGQLRYEARYDGQSESGWVDLTDDVIGRRKRKLIELEALIAMWER